jgi:hypothetical protein
MRIADENQGAARCAAAPPGGPAGTPAGRVTGTQQRPLPGLPARPAAATRPRPRPRCGAWAWGRSGRAPAAAASGGAGAGIRRRARHQQPILPQLPAGLRAAAVPPRPPPCLWLTERNLMGTTPLSGLAIWGANKKEGRVEATGRCAREGRRLGGSAAPRLVPRPQQPSQLRAPTCSKATQLRSRWRWSPQHQLRRGPQGGERGGGGLRARAARPGLSRSGTRGPPPVG